MTADPGLPAVEARGVDKVYRVYRGHGRGWVRSLLAPWWPRERFAHESTALEGVDLAVRPGEAVALLGRNGSGKSTLLRVLAGMTAPSSGEVTVRGRLRCIMAPGAGFNGRLSGRENALYGSIAMGVPRATALERLEGIVDFAELREHMDKPLMYYSRGMRARLALAVALQETPDVLIVDEALTAGDASFTARCRERVEEICTSGNAVLLATHSLSLAREACTRAIVLDGGRLVADGDPAAGVDTYLELLGQMTPEAEDEPEPEAAPAPAVTEEAATVAEAWMCGEDGVPRESFAHGERIELHAVIETMRPIERPRFRVELMSVEAGVRVTQLGTHFLDAGTGELGTLRAPGLDGRYELVVAWPSNPLGSGEFFWRLSLFPWSQGDAGVVTRFLRASRVCPFTSVAFPQRGWERRRTLIEAASEVTLSPLEPPFESTRAAE